MSPAKRHKTYDQKCFDLAENFLADEAKRDSGDTERLATTIQEAIEDWLTELNEGNRS